MTDHTHVREAEPHYVDTDTCVHQLQPPEPGRVLTLAPLRVSAAAQCPRPVSFLVAGWPSCDGHVVAVIVWEHERGNPDVVVRRIV